MKIPFHKPYITDDEINEIVDSLRSGWLTMGPKTVRFEEEFRNYINTQHAVSVNSCTAALHLALQSIGLKQGDEVIIPTMTFTTTGEVVCYFGAKPVVVDSEKDTHNIDAAKIAEAVTHKTKAIIPVHFGGQPCDMDEIIGIAKGNGLYVIEDAAHSLPALYNDKTIGTIGDITCFSFYATKTLSTGEGGMITTENADWAKKIKILRLHGISEDAWNRYSDNGSWFYEVVDAGYKYNMTDIQAALGIAQLKKLEWMLQKRKVIADKYTGAFSGSDVIMPPTIKNDRTSSWHLYVIKLNLEALNIDRAMFIEELKLLEVDTSVHFIPLHRHPFYKNTYGYASKQFPNAEWIYERIISLPIYPGMTDEETDAVIECVLHVAKKHRR